LEMKMLLKARQLALYSLVFLLSALFYSTPLLAAKELSVDLNDVIKLTLKNNSEIQASKAASRSADASMKQARGHYGPVLSVSSNVLFWDKESTMSLGGDSSALSQLPAPQTPYEMAFAGLMDGLSKPTTLQEDITSTTQLTAAMPLNQLYQIHQGYKVEKLNKQIAEDTLGGTSSDKVLSATEAYFRLLQAKAQNDTAQKAVEHLEEQMRIVEVSLEHGILALKDKLRMSVALADSRQKLIQAKSNVDLARVNLLTIMGVDLDTSVDAKSISGEVPGKPILSVDEGVMKAVTGRYEIKQLKRNVEQADRGRKAAIANMLPNFALMGAYQHQEGVKMGAQDSLYGGLVVAWDFWEWGSTYYGIAKNKETRNRLSHLKKHAERMVALQVRKAYIDFQTAFETIKVTEAAVAQAEEAFSIESENFASGMGTTADVLDAESALTQAQNNNHAALFQCFIAKATYIRSTGEMITADKIVN